MNARQGEFRRQLDTLGSWSERAQRIDEGLAQTNTALASRNASLVALQNDLCALTRDFWYGFRQRSLPLSPLISRGCCALLAAMADFCCCS